MQANTTRLNIGLWSVGLCSWVKLDHATFHAAVSLAFLGDAVWEAHVREKYFIKGGKQSLHDYNLSVKRHAGAVQQVKPLAHPVRTSHHPETREMICE